MTVVVTDGIAGRPGLDALSFEDGVIRWVGPSHDLPPTDDVVRLEGFVLPGLRDAHAHPAGLAAAGTRLDLRAARSLDDAREAIARRIAEEGGDVPVVAEGLDDERITEGRMPTAAELDEVTGAVPTLVYRHCSHIASANAAALALAGIDPGTPDPTGGSLRRDATGTPTGVLEETAIGPVASALAPLLPPLAADALSSSLAALSRRGLVAIHAMAATSASSWCSGSDEVDLLLSLGDVAPLDVDVFVITEDPDDLAASAERLRRGPDWLRFAGWKGFADGSLGGHTAHLRDPYHDAAHRGTRRTDGASLLAMAEVAIHLGGTAAIHAIGDAAVESALSIGESLGPGSVRIEHASVCDGRQVARMADAGVTASVQPSFVTSDGPWLVDRLGDDRLPWAYPFRTMLDAGVNVIGGSDAPIESADPFVGMADAMRPRPEALTWDQALSLYAVSSVSPGQDATFLVVDRLGGDDGPDAVTGTQVRARWRHGSKVGD